MQQETYAIKMTQVLNGKKCFQCYMAGKELEIHDSVILLLTKDENMIKLGKKYIRAFCKMHKIKNLYLFTYRKEISVLFNEENVIVCQDENELLCIAQYLSIFEVENQIIFFTEKDLFGAKVERLLKKNSFSLEEYVAIGLLRLEKLEDDINGFCNSANI